MAYTLEDIPTLRAAGWSSEEIAQLLGVPWEVVFHYLLPPPVRRVYPKRKPPERPPKKRRKPRPKRYFEIDFEPTPCPFCQARCSTLQLAAQHCLR